MCYSLGARSSLTWCQTVEKQNSTLKRKGTTDGLGIRNAGRSVLMALWLRCRCDSTAGLGVLSCIGVVSLNLQDVTDVWVQDLARLNLVEAVRVDRQSNPSDLLADLPGGTELRRQL